MFLQSQAELALGSRFKALSERFYELANAAYRMAGIEFDSHWFPVLRYVQVKGPGTVSEIAAAIGQTHSAVSQMASKLRRGGWITRGGDRADGRRSVLDLSAEGERRLGGMGPVWCAIRRGAREAIARSGGALLEGLRVLEAEFDSGRLDAYIRAQYARLRDSATDVKRFAPQWRAAFHDINMEWLERYFAIEDIDRRVLSEPEKYIIAPGGAVFIALVDGEPIGTCALLKDAPGVYELSKMAVATGWRGRGAGRLLLDTAIGEFRRRRGRMLFLESNSRLAPALTLYESAGFVRQPERRPGSHYQRSDVYMIFEEPATRRRRATG
ncbi:MAG TPA: bifunctional helix-turn-helix transcriptional regulator/GNAT family N-acetyltransferase [Rudaea sp.]|jgi:DNA-binding MarR family transcriptional regulator/N-acetylglutamate synthase-like GNAT family acetyltransferase|nr:bifunctional helix-turn-helix transcriptional regulator/GNAT family N-acetyltransferase [Rudaea sp.]